MFLNSTRLDACPFLRNREGETRSAACIPLSIAGATIGVIHTTGAEDEPPDATELSEFELVARRAGDRIGFLRVLARSEMQAGVDVLTGLFNRRSVEQRATEVLEQGNEFVVAFADLDNLKDLNDKYGHETGDRALRLFGRVLRDSVRPAPCDDELNAARCPRPRVWNDSVPMDPGISPASFSPARVAPLR